MAKAVGTIRENRGLVRKADVAPGVFPGPHRQVAGSVALTAERRREVDRSVRSTTLRIGQSYASPVSEGSDSDKSLVARALAQAEERSRTTDERAPASRGGRTSAERPAGGGAPRKHARYVRGALSEVEEARSRRAERWAGRAVVAALGDWQAGTSPEGWESVPYRRVAACGRCATGETVALKVGQHDDGQHAFISGTQTCGAIWACRVCSTTIRTRRKGEVQQAATEWAARGGRLTMLTLTMRHDENDGLADLMTALSDAWRAVQRRRPWQRWSKVMHGTITATEITQGFGSNEVNRSGWHPHKHLLLFIPGGEEGEQLELELAAWLPEAWARAVEKRLGKRPDEAHGVHLLPLDASAAEYVAKLSDEVTRGDLKSGSRQPWALLGPVADGEAWAVARWLEYDGATRGRRALVWSDGLRADLIPDIEDLTDEELAAEEVEGEVVALVAAADWLRLMRPPHRGGTPPAVLVLAEVEAALARGAPPTGVAGSILARHIAGLVTGGP